MGGYPSGPNGSPEGPRVLNGGGRCDEHGRATRANQTGRLSRAHRQRTMVSMMLEQVQILAESGIEIESGIENGVENESGIEIENEIESETSRRTASS